MMEYDEKRKAALDSDRVQEGNRRWWTSNTMSYDWRDRSAHPRFSAPWYDDIDQRFRHAARLFSDAANPFAALMGLHDISGKRVLEIGCGMGFHSEILGAAGARLTSIDLSPTSVEATSKRMQLKALPVQVLQMDAEHLGFADGEFDLVWSWGVIHHSSRTGRIVREVERVLKPAGEARIMVYNLEGAAAYAALVSRYLFGFWRGRSLDEILWRSTDGFSARFYTRDSLGDLLRAFFEHVDVSVLGQESDVVLLPRTLRSLVLGMIPLARQRETASRRGSFLFAVARKEG